MDSGTLQLQLMLKYLIPALGGSNISEEATFTLHYSTMSKTKYFFPVSNNFCSSSSCSHFSLEILKVNNKANTGN